MHVSVDGGCCRSGINTLMRRLRDFVVQRAQWQRQGIDGWTTTVFDRMPTVGDMLAATIMAEQSEAFALTRGCIVVKVTSSCVGPGRAGEGRIRGMCLFEVDRVARGSFRPAALARICTVRARDRMIWPRLAPWLADGEERVGRKSGAGVVGKVGTTRAQ